MSGESQEEWRKRVLAEASRLRNNVAAAKHRREATQRRAAQDEGGHHGPAVHQDDLDGLEDAHIQLKKKKTTMVLELQKQVQQWKREEALEGSQLAKLELAESELEATNKRLAKLAKQVAEEEGEGEGEGEEGDNKAANQPHAPHEGVFHEGDDNDDLEIVTGRAVPNDGPDDLVSQSYIHHAEATWSALARNASVLQELQQDSVYGSGMWSARWSAVSARESNGDLFFPSPTTGIKEEEEEEEEAGREVGKRARGEEGQGKDVAKEDEGKEERREEVKRERKEEGKDEGKEEEGKEEGKDEGREDGKREGKGVVKEQAGEEEEVKEDTGKRADEVQHEEEAGKNHENPREGSEPKQQPQPKAEPKGKVDNAPREPAMPPPKSQPQRGNAGVGEKRGMNEHERLQQLAEERKRAFMVPGKPTSRLRQADYRRIVDRMTLTAPPLIFFNLACFRDPGEGDTEVMLPVCGFAAAATLLAVMGPPGTNLSTLRAALVAAPSDGSGHRDVSVVDFSVRTLLFAADHVLRKDDMDKAKSLEEILGLEDAAEVVIGTCIQRGETPGQPTLGTARGSRHPEAPTPRNPHARCIPGSTASLHKSILLLHDLPAVLKADEVFKVVRVLKKIAHHERAAAIVTLARPFERRGLVKLFDDVLLFSTKGVCYFGPTKYLPMYCALVGSPAPSHVHVTDHVLRIRDITTRFHASPIRLHVASCVAKFAEPASERTPRDAQQRKSRSKSIFGLPKLRRTRRRAKEEQLPDGFDEGSVHAKKLAQRLEAEQRQMAEQQEAAAKMDIWARLAALDGDVHDGSRDECSGFEQLVVYVQQASKDSLPSCFMNLACFMNTQRWPTDLSSAVIQPTVAFASEGRVLGVIGPRGIDASNLLETLRLGSDLATVIADLSVKDTLRMAEFVNDDKGTPQSQDIAVHLLMAKMMLTACAREVVGTIIQRSRDSVAKKIKIGNKAISTTTRSVLILDHIVALDAQSLYVVLKLIKLIAVPARLAVVVVTNKPEEQQGLLHLFDNALAFSEEGVFYFGPARHLRSYCRLVDMAAPPGRPIVDHVQEMMALHAPSKFDDNPDNLNTPFTTRFEQSALGKYNARIFDIGTKPPDQGGHLTSRMLIPKTFRRRASRSMPAASARERAEESRKRAQAQRDSEQLAQRLSEEHDKRYEAALMALAKQSPGLAHGRGGRLHAGLRSIADDMAASRTRPSLFFNLASFLPDVESDRIDVFQPICGFALAGRVVGLMGCHGSDVSSFVRAMADPGDSEGQGVRQSSYGSAITVAEVVQIGAQVGVDSPEALDKLQECAKVEIGTVLRRGTPQSANSPGQCILALDAVSSKLSPKQLFAFVSFLRVLGPRADITTIAHLTTKAERRGLFALLDDCMAYDENGVSYFGPARHLHSYLVLSGFEVHRNEHPTDALFRLMEQYSHEYSDLMPTDTSPAVRYRYSPLATYVNSVAEEITGVSPVTQRAELREQMGQALAVEGRSTPALSLRKKGHNKEEQRENEAALRRLAIAESEAERERQRVAEAQAEGVWRRLGN